MTRNKEVELIGSEWDLENYLGILSKAFILLNKIIFIEFPHLEDEPQAELLARIQCGDFVREIGNLPSSIITPIELAKLRTLNLSPNKQVFMLTKVKVSFQIIPDKDLLKKTIKGFGKWVKAQKIYQLCYSWIQMKNAFNTFSR